MPPAKRTQFDPARFLEAAGVKHRVIQVATDHVFFSQGGSANSIFFLESGRAKLTVVSKRGKEATVRLFFPGDFIGEESLAGQSEVHTATATAVVPCHAQVFDRKEMLKLLHEHEFSNIFLKFVLLRGIRTQEDLVDQLFNNSEKRLARTLLIMAGLGKTGEMQSIIPPITQEALADLIGTTRSRVSFFMNRFRRLGYVTYNGRIHVHRSLLDVLLHDRLPEHESETPDVAAPEEVPKKVAKKKP